MMYRFLAVISISLLVSACQTTGPQPSTDTWFPATENTVSGPAANEVVIVRTVEPEEVAPAAPYANLWRRIASGLQFADIDNGRIERERQQLLSKPDFFPVVSKRAEMLLFYIVEQVEERDMPIDLALLPVIESSFNTYAYSSGRAAGLWQIIPSTGYYLGLKRNWWYDGRRDLRASTDAALNYLQSLSDLFEGDWQLALAAYNGGKGRVRKARNKNRAAGRDIDFWSLSLPRETERYVPRLIALSSLIADPEKYAITLEAIPNQPRIVSMDTGGQIELKRVAELARLDYKELRNLNAGYRRWATPPDEEFGVILPLEHAAAFKDGLAGLSRDQRVNWQHYTIERGDTLGALAKAFNTDIGALMAANKLMTTRIRAGDSLLIPGSDGYEHSLAMQEDDQPPQRMRYRVRRGDSLYRIAGRFNVKVRDIIRWNELDPKRYLQPGQRLTLFVGPQ